jgi:hypothetical protein
LTTLGGSGVATQAIDDNETEDAEADNDTADKEGGALASPAAPAASSPLVTLD